VDGVADHVGRTILASGPSDINRLQKKPRKASPRPHWAWLTSSAASSAQARCGGSACPQGR